MEQSKNSDSQQNVEEQNFDAFFQHPLFCTQVTFNIDQLNYRYKRLQAINTHAPSLKQEYLMAFDAFLVVFRALFLERGQRQYTIQNFYRAKGDNEKADKIDAYLDLPAFTWKNVSIRDMLKFIADKFICHVDPISTEDLGTANFYMTHLANPYDKNNLETIMTDLNRIINE